MRQLMRGYLFLGLLLSGCAGQNVARVPAPIAPPADFEVVAPKEKPTQPQTKHGEQNTVAIVPPAPAECNAFSSHLASSGVECSDRATALAALDLAMARTDALARDAELAVLGSCKLLELGLITALRAELAPPLCGDLLVGNFAEVNKGSLNPAIHDAIAGLGLAAELARLVRTAPQMEKPYTKERVDAFVKGVVARWALEQANAISAISLRGARLSGYGKGLVAVEAGMADMRFVEAFRQVPIPDEFASDPELSDAYYSSLDQGLEPRKARGRDAALVGLRAFSEVGVLRDARVHQARELLSKLFNGRRIDALDRLLVPARPEPELLDVEHRLAIRLPTFYVEFVLDSVDPNNVSLVRALLERGLPTSLQSKLDRSALSGEARRMYARALFERGRIYWNTSDFALAAALATTRQMASDEARLVAALAKALEKGPRDAASMMLGSTKLTELGDSAPLESLARAKTPIAGMAAYDAAVLRELGSATESSAEFFRDLARRYEQAASMLTDATQKSLARERAAAAVETAKKVQ